MENKTIIEIGKSLTQSQRTKIVNEIASRGQICGPVAYRYLAGATIPLYLYKKTVCEVINEVLNLNLTIEELWPDA